MIRSMALLAALLAAAAANAADIQDGKAVFHRCKICHSVSAGGPERPGPSLHGVFGRKAGTYDNFDYSRAMKHSGIIWGDATLAKYLHNPKAFIPGNHMAFPGIKDDAKLTDLLAYLKEATK
jgi:cytochrome c